MSHIASVDDIRFKNAFENFEIDHDSFRHRAHLRVAYTYLCESDVETAHKRMRTALKRFLIEKEVAPDKFNETFTYFWIRIVDHFMRKSPGAPCFDDFVANAQDLLKNTLIFSYYRPQTVVSEAGRHECLMPDLRPIT